MVRAALLTLIPALPDANTIGRLGRRSGRRAAGRNADVREADLNALVGDLDAAAAGDFPVDGQRGGREWFGSRESYALELVALAGREGQGTLPAG